MFLRFIFLILSLRFLLKASRQNRIPFQFVKPTGAPHEQALARTRAQETQKFPLLKRPPKAWGRDMGEADFATLLNFSGPASTLTEKDKRDTLEEILLNFIERNPSCPMVGRVRPNSPRGGHTRTSITSMSTRVPVLVCTVRY